MTYIRFKDKKYPIAGKNILLKDLVTQEMRKPKYKEKKYNLDTIELEFVKSVTDVDEV